MRNVSLTSCENVDRKAIINLEVNIVGKRVHFNMPSVSWVNNVVRQLVYYPFLN